MADASGMIMFWRRLTLDFRIFLAAAMELVITVMSWILSIFMAGISPVQIAIISASRGVTFIE